MFKFFEFWTRPNLVLDTANQSDELRLILLRQYEQIRELTTLIETQRVMINGLQEQVQILSTINERNLV